MSKQICPLLGKKCIEHDCRLWTHVIGRNPQSGSQVDNWDCALAWIPVMLVENAGEQRKTQATVQHFNNQLHVTFSALAGRPLPALSGSADGDAKAMKSFIKTE